MNSSSLAVVRAYHERTKHHPQRYAASPGQMDWANQPHPFRSFAGAPTLELEHPAPRQTPTHDGLFHSPPSAAQLTRESISRFFYHSLALSAWKKTPFSKPWSLRVNPSSGDLHPTEGYLVSGPIEGLSEAPGVFHYGPFRHSLEVRGQLSSDSWERWRAATSFPESAFLIGLTSIYWRESWKYGERAFRYCHHDVGHAVGALTFAARALGWSAVITQPVSTSILSHLLGTSAQSGPEAEKPDLLLLVGPPDWIDQQRANASDCVACQAFTEMANSVQPTGEPNRLSHAHRDWPVIDEVSRAAAWSEETASRFQGARTRSSSARRELPEKEERPTSAEQLIRQRRSAVDMDGKTTISRADFTRMMRRVLPDRFPQAAFPWTPRVSLAIFAHRVADMEPGLYVLARCERHEASLRGEVDRRFRWDEVEGVADDLPLYRLASGDCRDAARAISCHQDIAADGAFALGMLAEYDAALEEIGADYYPCLFWETGIIGQTLYLEAEAAGARATGIGCFFDDQMHQLLGLTNRRWQSLYHFTIGGPVEDTRLRTLPPYAHLTTGLE